MADLQLVVVRLRVIVVVDRPGLALSRRRVVGRPAMARHETDEPSFLQTVRLHEHIGRRVVADREGERRVGHEGLVQAAQINRDGRSVDGLVDCRLRVVPGGAVRTIDVFAIHQTQRCPLAGEHEAARAQGLDVGRRVTVGEVREVERVGGGAEDADRLLGPRVKAEQVGAGVDAGTRSNHHDAGGGDRRLEIGIVGAAGLVESAIDDLQIRDDFAADRGRVDAPCGKPGALGNRVAEDQILLGPEGDGGLRNVVAQERERAGYMADVADVHDRPGVAPEDVEGSRLSRRGRRDRHDPQRGQAGQQFTAIHHARHAQSERIAGW